jgi:hypothetical protein
VALLGAMYHDLKRVHRNKMSLQDCSDRYTDEQWQEYFRCSQAVLGDAKKVVRKDAKINFMLKFIGGGTCVNSTECIRIVQ